MYLTPSNKFWAIDIEGDGLLDTVTRIWCLCAANVITGEEVSVVGHDAIKEWIDERIKEDCYFIGHNVIGYDAPALNRIVGTRLTISRLIDTLLLSMVYSPSLDGGHSLESWGKRLKSPKLDWHDFSQFSDEMLVYCRQDTALCRKIYRELCMRMNRAKFTERGIEIEHRSWQLIKMQQANGFHFNIGEAYSLYALLRQEEDEIKEKLYEIWPPELQLVRTFSRPYKKDGTQSRNLERHLVEYERVVIRREADQYDCYAYVSFNIGSPSQRTERLVELGWEPRPDERTPTGQPKPTAKGQLVPSLQEFVEESGKEGPKLIAQWIEINARANMINTWIEAYDELTGCIHGSLWLANTLRYRHSNPNTANIPAVRVDKCGNPLRAEAGVFTYEARDLWSTRDRKRRRLVGVDAKGIQLRVLAHYLNNAEFTEAVVSGDPHSFNQAIGGFATRAIAKTFIYAFLLGAGDAKVGQIISGSTKEGKAIKARFIGNFPGLKELLDDLERQIEKTGRITLCDGTPIIVSQPHTRLGYLLQGDESRIMKQAAILIHREVTRRKLDVLKVCDVHDEFQYDVAIENVEELTQEILPMCFKKSGELFNYRVPIECSTNIGLTWSQTH